MWGPHGERVRGYGYDPVLTNLLTSVTNALEEVTRYTYDAKARVTSISYPGGLVTTNIYYPSGLNAGFLQCRIDLGYSTNYFDYLNGNLSARTNELGLVTTYTCDNLNRLLSVAYPDRTTNLNVYTWLDLTATKDRRDNWTRWSFNPLRQVVALTNANAQVTQYSYCDCGTLDRITNGLGANALVTQYFYDLAGRLTNSIYPDLYSVRYVYQSEGDHLYQVDRFDRPRAGVGLCRLRHSFESGHLQGGRPTRDIEPDTGWLR